MYLTSFCPPLALILRILLPPLLYAVVPAGKITRVGLQPPPLTLLLSLCLAGFVFTCLLLCPGPVIWFEILAAVNAIPLLLFRIVHPLVYGNYGQLRGRERSGHTTVALRGTTTQMGTGNYPSWGTSNYPLHCTALDFSHRQKGHCCREVFREAGVGLQGDEGKDSTTYPC